MRVPLTEHDRVHAVPRLARQAASHLGVPLSQAQQLLCSALGFRDLHELKETTLPGALQLSSVARSFGLSVGEAQIHPGVSAAVLARHLGWNLGRQTDMPLGAAVDLAETLQLQWLDLWAFTWDHQMELGNTERGDHKPLPPPPRRTGRPAVRFEQRPPTPLELRAARQGAPAREYVIQNRQVFLWGRLQRLLAAVPEDAAISGTQLQDVISQAWQPLSEALGHGDLPRLNIVQLRDDAHSVPPSWEGWVVLDQAEQGVLPQLYPDRAAALQGLQDWLTRPGTLPAGPPGSTQPGSDLRPRRAGHLFLQDATFTSLPLLRIQHGQLRGPVFLSREGRVLLSALDLRGKTRTDLPWALLGVTRPTLDQTPPEWDRVHQTLHAALHRLAAPLAGQLPPDPRGRTLLALALHDEVLGKGRMMTLMDPFVREVTRLCLGERHDIPDPEEDPDFEASFPAHAPSPEAAEVQRRRYLEDRAAQRVRNAQEDPVRFARLAADQLLFSTLFRTALHHDDGPAPSPLTDSLLALGLDLHRHAAPRRDLRRLANLERQGPEPYGPQLRLPTEPCPPGVELWGETVQTDAPGERPAGQSGTEQDSGHEFPDRKQTRKPTLLRVGPGSPC